MKIGIITQPFHSNYGGILQNYALQQVLKRMGHDVWTVDYGSFDWWAWANIAWRVIAHKMLWHESHFSMTPGEVRKRELPLRRFVSQYITLTEPRTKRFERKTIKPYAFDAIVVGSDQVWRPQYNYDVRDCFLQFAKDMQLKRIAYAASFGTDEWEFTDMQTAECAQLAKLFDGISVREKSGVTLCKQHLGVEAELVLDPTLLLQAADYIDLCKNIPRRKPFVFAYILDGNEEKLKKIVDISNRKGLGYIIKSADAAISINDSIELWLSYFRDAAFVITDSFHGTAFAINFNKDFYVFGNADRGNSRFDSLLSILGLEKRMTNANTLERQDSIDWKCVNHLRESYAQYSKEWLKQVLR